MADIANMPGHLIRRFQQIAVAIFHREVEAAGFDLTPVQYAALECVARAPDIDQATLAGLIAYDRTTITGVVDRLVAKGLLTRKVNEKDRRARTLHASDAGLDVLRRVAPSVEAAQRAMLKGLSEQEADEFLRLTRKALGAVNDLSRAPLRQR
ncbi:MarR family transcriptional regulator [Breoghania corrubedonensis]|uniref:MarR family transcriptional regulator n=1 Tax=Breoghania corrubedonensis TaxID=665038 RepID=A0A2T5VH13_9HYPH|nr:MarR family transcriptional regulator [Breoghania corrubedonensis]PTW63026.1 MarR family transcriptional regulator [Breoghania corrubedonensis]